MTDEEYRATYERYKSLSARITDPVEFYQHVRSEGSSKLGAFYLLRDLYNKNLLQCMAIKKAVEGSDAGDF